MRTTTPAISTRESMMNLVMQLVNECLTALNERHNVTAGYLADAAYMLSMSKKLPYSIQKQIKTVTYKIDYGDFKGAKRVASEILKTMVLI